MPRSPATAVVRKTMALPQSLADALTRQAIRRGVPENQIMIEALMAYLNIEVSHDNA